MLQLAIPIPSVPGIQDIDMEMNIQGKKQKLHFKVQVFTWDECVHTLDERIECIRDIIREYGEEWSIYHIGSPTETFVPLTFIRTDDWNRQRKMMMEVLKEG
ncbi:MAG TPA: hypothetical protein P5275_05295 [Saprospiraceae bacterium]|nr:hypothetical protein [Saprospiraceae bacterium]MCB9272327.1 hypothetical protein [Lewinellaceae bacterium]HPG05330.1 hypothetical protein [Saprospiraceae bacterium]HPQ98126.1 hypothetical protein [Saprospiraceae bacterium]HQU52820.1 hypothetical protein [Saprospiraceae bacterium]